MMHKYFTVTIIFMILSVRNAHAMHLTKQFFENDPFFEQLQGHVYQRNNLVKEIEKTCSDLKNTHPTLEIIIEKSQDINSLNNVIITLSETIQKLLLYHLNPSIEKLHLLNEKQLIDRLNKNEILDEKTFELITKTADDTRSRLINIEKIYQEIFEQVSRATTTTN